MSSALLRQASPEETLLRGARDAALRTALEEARQLTAQTRLLALNTAFESAGAGPAEDGDAAGVVAAEAERVASAVELLLQQIQSTSFQSGPL
jgi:hypothetical protein